MNFNWIWFKKKKAAIKGILRTMEEMRKETGF